MKTKGMNIVEKMIEKVVLAAAMLIFLVVFALQFLGSPTVDLPGGLGTGVPIEQAADVVANAARTKKAQLESIAGADSVPQPVDLSQDLIGRFSSPVAERSLALAAPVPSWGDSAAPIIVDPGTLPSGDDLYNVPAPLPTSRPVVAVTLGTLDPSIRLLYPVVADLLPEQQPYDKAFVSLQFDWDAAANRALMGRLSGSDDLLVLPQTWRESMEIWDVEVVRRELGSDGQWSAETVVPPMPGRASLRERVVTATPPDIPAIEAEERRLRSGIRQPRMYNLIAGDFWNAPVLVRREQELTRPAEVDRLVRQIRSLRREIEDVQRRLDGLDGVAMRTPTSDRLFDIGAPAPDAIRWPNFDNSARAQAGGGGSGGGGGGPREDPNEATRRTLTERLNRLNTQLDRAVRQLEALGYDADGNRIDEEVAGIENFTANAILSASSTQAETLDFWAHDLTALPGATYQYAVRLKIRNPLFGNANSVSEDQRELANQPVIASERSEWSEPVQIPSLSEYFVVAATDASVGMALTTGPSVTVEVFRYFYGAWRRETLRLGIGDSLRSPVTLPQGLQVFRISKGPDNRLVLDGEDSIAGRQLEFSRNHYLLDVAAGVEQFVLAFFRDEQGQILTRDPNTDRNAQRLAQMRADAQQAAEQTLRPLDLTDESSPQPGRPDRPDRPGPPPGDDGGGSPPAGPGGPSPPPGPFG